MKKLFALAALTSSLLLSQTPDITGVWKADLEKSKRMGPPITNYLAIIEQKNAIFDNRTKEEAPLVTQTTGTWGQRGEQRTVLSFFNRAKSAVRLYQGVPTRLTASTESNKLVVNGEVAGRPSTYKWTYALSADGKTLTLDEEGSNEGRMMHSTMVLLKQDDAAGDLLRKPEELAEKHFKNVKTASLKSLPVSEYFNQMRYIAWSLGKDCEFCHVERKFDSDDKKEKVTARKMIDMTAAINEHNFENKPEVRCFTCHEGHGHPLSRPLYSDEIAAAEERAAKEAAEKAAHQPPPPGPPPQH
jgi:hypothetical protein